jgi:Protein of unknown function (DUF4007)
MTVYFHGSFGLNRQRMAEILRVTLKDPGLRDQEIAEPFGYNAPFTARYRSWLHKTGLIEMKYPIRLTKMGKVVYEHDPGLESLTTQWFIHKELATDPDRAEAWHFFVHEFLTKHKTFSKDDLLAGLTEKLRAHSEKHFGPGSNLNKVILRKLLECYTAKEALGEIKLINEKKGVYTYNEKSKIKRSWKSAADLIKAYR